MGLLIKFASKIFPEKIRRMLKNIAGQVKLNKNNSLEQFPMYSPLERTLNKRLVFDHRTTVAIMPERSIVAEE